MVVSKELLRESTRQQPCPNIGLAGQKTEGQCHVGFDGCQWRVIQLLRVRLSATQLMSLPSDNHNLSQPGF
jgi:hypothetical protein